MKDSSKKLIYNSIGENLLGLKKYLNSEEFKKEAISELNISEVHISIFIESISGTIDAVASGKPLKEDPINDYLKTLLERGNNEEFWSMIRGQKVPTGEIPDIKDNMLKLISVLKEIKYKQ